MSHWAQNYLTLLQFLSRLQRRSFFQPGAGRVGTLLVAAVAVTLLIADDQAVAEMLFQSPASPPAEPAAPAEPPPAPPEQPSTEAAPDEQQPTSPVPGQQSPVAPPTETPAAIVPVTPDLSTGTEPPAFVQPTALPRSRSRDDITTVDTEASTFFILDQVEFVDTVVVSGAYVWLCCGIVLLLLLPLIFLFLQIRGQIKIQREEDI